MVVSSLREHFLLNRTQGVTPPSVQMQLKEVLAASWGTAEKGKGLLNCLVSKKVPCKQLGLMGSGSSQAQLPARCSTPAVI